MASGKRPDLATRVYFKHGGRFAGFAGLTRHNNLAYARLVRQSSLPRIRVGGCAGARCREPFADPAVNSGASKYGSTRPAGLCATNASILGPEVISAVSSLTLVLNTL